MDYRVAEREFLAAGELGTADHLEVVREEHNFVLILMNSGYDYYHHGGELVD